MSLMDSKSVTFLLTPVILPNLGLMLRMSLLREDAIAPYQFFTDPLLHRDITALNKIFYRTY